MNNEVTSLGYIVITAEDKGAWASFAESILGLQVVPQPQAGEGPDTVYLRMDERSWRIAVSDGVDGGLEVLGFEVANKAAFISLKSRLSLAGIAVKESPGVAEARGVVELFQVQDPNGVAIEFFYGAKSEKELFVSPVGARFVTGEGGLGHAALLLGDADEAYAFYVDVLGFRVSDVLAMGPNKVYFTSPNPRHHTFAFGAMPGMPPTVLHIMLQVDDIDTVGRALDRVYDAGVPLQSGLGRHTNDQMLSFYCVSPSGLQVEYGWGAREIDSRTHTTGYFDAPSLWGHRLPDGTDPIKMLLEAMQAEPPVT